MKQEKLKEKTISSRFFNCFRFNRGNKPHMIFAAGDLADPHGTHKQCLISIITQLIF